MQKSYNTIQLLLLKILIALLPFHYFIFYIVLGDIPMINLWKEFIMMLIVLLGILKSKSLRNIGLTDLLILFFIMLSLIYTVCSTVPKQAITIGRVYVLPLVFFWSITKVRFSRYDLLTMLKIIEIDALIVCVYGIFQAWVLGDKYLISLGYPSNGSGNLNASLYLSNYNGGVLSKQIQRVNSTLSSANTCAFYLCLVEITILMVNRYFSRLLNLRVNFQKILLIIIAITIFLTFSRSSWLAMVIVTAIYVLQGKKVKCHSFIRIICLIAIMIVVILILDLLGIKTISIAISHIIKSTFSGTDTSIISHSNSLSSALNLISKNWLGLGLGLNGPRALNFGNSNLVESSYLLMVFEYGIPGMILYFANYINILVRSIKCFGFKRNIELLLSLFILIAFINIPYVQEYECMTIYFVLIVIGRRMNEYNCMLRE